MAEVQAKQNIIVAGYPKSGNTWACRLIAEAIGCPVAGFLGQPRNKEIAMEGFERQSGFQVLKSHHPFNGITQNTEPRDKLVYMVRDPRDVAVSGAHYFRISRFRDVNSDPRIDRYEAMVRTICSGGPFSWCNEPWANHVQEYLENGVFHVRYEDLLLDPVNTLVGVMQYLGVEADLVALQTAIYNQSFKVAKRRYKRLEDKRRTRFMRAGVSGQYKYVLTPEQIGRIQDHCEEVMNKLGYELNKGLASDLRSGMWHASFASAGWRLARYRGLLGLGRKALRQRRSR